MEHHHERGKSRHRVDARRQSQPGRRDMLLELSVDKPLNTFEPIQFAHRHGHPDVLPHGEPQDPGKGPA